MNARQECRRIVREAGINGASRIDFRVNDESMSFSLDEIIDLYMQGSEASQLVFLAALQKSSASQEEIERFFEGMGKLLLMSQLSEKFQ